MVLFRRRFLDARRGGAETLEFVPSKRSNTSGAPISVVDFSTGLLTISALENLNKRMPDEEDAAMDRDERWRKMLIAGLNKMSKGVTFGGPIVAAMNLDLPTHYGSYREVFINTDPRGTGVSVSASLASQSRVPRGLPSDARRGHRRLGLGFARVAEPSPPGIPSDARRGR